MAQIHWTPKRINALFHLSSEMALNPKSMYAKDKILCQAFFEPSTRTALSFECAMKKMGGQVIHFHPYTSSIQKGESDLDTIRTLANYCDVIVLRPPDSNLYEEACEMISATTSKPIDIVNAGNGSSNHPTQALLDLYTMYKKFGNDFKHKRILLVGDIKHSRTIHSLVELLRFYSNMQIFVYPYPQCEPSDDYVAQIAHDHYMDTEDVVIPTEMLFYEDYDVIYITRKQTEKHDKPENESESENESDSEDPYCFTEVDASCLGPDTIIMHPFPRNDELDPSVDAFSQAYYFQQMQYGVELRMGLLEQLFHNQDQYQDQYQDQNQNQNQTNYASELTKRPTIKNESIKFYKLLLGYTLFYWVMYVCIKYHQMNH